jgi:PAS domain S-box-containing protein
VVRMRGYPLEEINSVPLDQQMTPESLQRAMLLFTKALSAENLGQPNPRTVYSIDLEFYHKDGYRIWSENTFTLILDPGGQPVNILGSGRDITERKQAEEAQRQSELLFRTLYDLSPDAVILIDPHNPNISWPIIDCNAAACLMNGYSRDEMIGRSIDILNSTPGTLMERDAYVKRLREAGNLKLETFHRHKNGTIFPIEVSTTFIKIGERELLIGIDRDITQRKQTEIEIEERTEELELINALNEAVNRGENLGKVMELFTTELRKISVCKDFAVYLLSPDGKNLFMQYLSMSPTLLKKIEQLTGSRLPEISIPLNKDSFFQSVLQSKQGIILTDPKIIRNRILEFTEPSYLSVVIRGTTRKLIPQIFKLLDIRSTLVLPLVSNKKVIGLLDVSSPEILTERDLNRIQKISSQLTAVILRIQSDESLLESEERYRTIFDGVQDAIFVETKDGKILEVNDSACEMYGYKRDEFLTKTVSDFVLEGSDVFVPHLSSSAPLETFNRRANGDLFPIEVSGEVQTINGEEVVLAIVRDITERKKAEKELHESEQKYRTLFDEMLSGVAVHEIICDEQGKPVDYRFIAINSAFEKMTGLVSAAVGGRTVREVLPAIEPLWIERYGQVALTRIPTQFENYSSELGKYFEVRAFSPEKGKFATIFNDVTERKQAEKLISEQSEQLRLLYEASRQLNRTLDLHTIYQTICDFMTIIAPNDGLVISAFDPETQLITCRAYWMENNWLDVSPFPSIPLEAEGKGTQSIAIRTGQSMLINDYQAQVKTAQTNYYVNSDEIVERLPPEEEEITRSALIVPLKVGGQVNGVIQVMSYRLNAYTENQLKLLEALALHIASAEQNALLYTRVQAELSERKQVEKSLREREEQYRMLVEQLPAIVYIDDANVEGRTLYVSPQIKTILGFTPQEWQAESPGLWNKQVYSGDLEQIHAGYMRCFQYGDRFDAEYRISASDGRLLWFRDQAVMSLDENGKPHLIHGLIYDITERKQVENELRQSEERFQQLVNNIEETFWITEAGREIYISPAGEKLWEVSIEKLYQERAFLENILPEDRQIVLDVIEKQLRGEKTEMEYRVQHSDGSIRWVFDRAFPVFNETGKILRVTGIATDITERKQAEENINQRVKELELLYESGLAFSQLLDPKEVAQKILKLLGEKLNWHHTTIRLIRGQDELELLAFDQPGLKDKVKTQAVESLFSSAITHVGEGLSGWALQLSKIIRLDEVSNDPHYVATYPGLHSGLYVPLKTGNRAIGVISIESEQPNAFNEADEQLLSTLANQAANAFENARLYKETIRYAEELEQRVLERTADLSLVNANLARAMRVKDEFLASMSHELRTPLTGILGLSEVLQLKMYGELNDKQRNTLRTIEESGRHLLDLINDILDLSKIDAGKFELQFAPCSLADVCQASLQLVKGMAQHKNLLVHYTQPTEPILVYVDARRLKQMLVNLLSNAIKFTPENGELGMEIQTIESERKFKVTVWDKGIGIKAEDLNRLFKPFVQLDSGLTREYSGTGLGLSLVSRLTELHNGGIEVESKFGEGSRFTIILPWSPNNTTPIPYAPGRNTGRLFNSALSPEDSTSPLIMIADDNEMILQMVASFFETIHYRVLKVRSGAELLERVAEIHPDIMLVDIQMPGIDGLETIRRIRAHADPQVASTPVIAITALAMPADRERCLGAGANDYISKPMKLTNLSATIQELLARKS